jgi:hypothetical protein
MAAKKPEYVYRSTLKKKEFGLTDSMIKKLGPPDKLVPNPHYKSGPPAQLYLVTKVKRWIARNRDSVDKAKYRREYKAEPKQCDLLASIFVVNRAAKRHRDAARTHYECDLHGFAGHAKSRKESLYGLKDRGIAAAFEAGRIQAVQIHGGLCLYRGEGYCFHSTLVPIGVDIPRSTDDAPITVEAKPRGSGEPLVRDAWATLEELPEADISRFSRLEVPRIERAESSSSIRCYACGELGHMARDCISDQYEDDEGHGMALD